ncbi:GNAT family N-acetyltransferase [Caviibacter abscessus]|uniref:GNAT family N-acetyltransferase n=1 Tax=Caviibacter abscessus TaxID=1766719 RepID=UPI0018D20E5F|nr:GNAT family N-acetyltransferase [Caviibacter abscessus]
MNLIIRKIKEKDKDIYLQLTNEFYNSNAVLHTVPNHYFTDTFNYLMKTDTYASCYILECNNEVSGYCLVSKTYSQEVSGMVLLIEEVYIREKFRGQGIGTKVFEFLKESYSDYKRLRLEVEKKNTEAKKLYEKIDFKILDYLQMVIDN